MCLGLPHAMTQKTEGTEKTAERKKSEQQTMIA